MPSSPVYRLYRPLEGGLQRQTDEATASRDGLERIVASVFFCVFGGRDVAGLAIRNRQDRIRLFGWIASRDGLPEIVHRQRAIMLAERTLAAPKGVQRIVDAMIRGAKHRQSLWSGVCNIQIQRLRHMCAIGRVRNLDHQSIWTGRQLAGLEVLTDQKVQTVEASFVD